MSKIKLWWAVLKGWLTPGTSAFLEVMSLALGVLNTFLARPDVASKVEKAYGVATAVLRTLDRFAGWCPQKWQADFDRIRAATAKVVEVFADGKVTEDEAARIGDLFRIEYARWSAD